MSQAELPVEVSCRDVAALRKAGEDFCFIDCREQDEYDLVRISGARLLPMSELGARVGELEAHKSERIVVHCHHGGRSLQVAAWLRRQGYARAQSMSGGIDAWAVEIEPGMARY